MFNAHHIGDVVLEDDIEYPIIVYKENGRKYAFIGVLEIGPDDSKVWQPIPTPQCLLDNKAHYEELVDNLQAQNIEFLTHTATFH